MLKYISNSSCVFILPSRIRGGFFIEKETIFRTYKAFILFLFSMNTPYRTIDEIVDIFSITLPTAKIIIKKYKVDMFKHKGIKVHVKDFYQAYTKHYNPSLFDTPTKKTTKRPQDISHIFQKLFGCAYTMDQ